MMGVDVLILMLLTNIAALKDAIPGTPRDYAALFEPQAVLEAWNVATDEASLIDLVAHEDKVRISPERIRQAISDLAGNDQARKRARLVLKAAGIAAIPELRQAARSEDPVVNRTARDLLGIHRGRQRPALPQDKAYVKQLMAVRLLEQRQTANALPALKLLAANATSPTLAAAAADAVAIIGGKQPQLPTGTDVIKDLLPRLPANTGFVAVADFARGRKAFTIGQVNKKLAEIIPATDGLKEFAPQTAILLPLAQKKLRQGLGMVGNIRIDAAVFGVSRDSGTAPRTGSAFLIVKGLYDPDRLTAALRLSPRIKERKHREIKILYQRDSSFCALDPNTFLIALSDCRDGSNMIPLLAALQQEPAKDKVPAPPLQAVFNQVLQHKTYIAAGGALSPAQKRIATITNAKAVDMDLDRHRQQPQPRTAMQLAFDQMVGGFIRADSCLAHVDQDLKLIVQANFADAADAAQFRQRLVRADQALRDMFAVEFEKAKDQPQAELLLEMFDFKKPFVMPTVHDNTVRLETPNAAAPIMLLPMMLTVKMTRMQEELELRRAAEEAKRQVEEKKPRSK